MWIIISGGMAGLVGSSGGAIWGALITGIVIFLVYIYSQEKNKKYNERVNINNENKSQKKNMKQSSKIMPSYDPDVLHNLQMADEYYKDNLRENQTGEEWIKMVTQGKVIKNNTNNGNLKNNRFLNTLALEIDVLLKDYIIIHNKRIKEGGTFLSLFRKVKFKNTYMMTSLLQKRFIDKAAELELISQRDLQSFNDEERKFFRLLCDYFLALYWTVQKLHKVSEAHYQRSQNTKNLSWKENQKLESDYKEAINGYITLGNELQEAY